MNNTRRKAISKLWEQIEEVKSKLESILEEEQDAYDSMPESLQDGERGEKNQAAIDTLELAKTALEEAVDYLIESSI